MAALLWLASAAPAAADTISLTPRQPLYAGANVAVTASGTTQPGADFEAAAALKPAGGACAADPGDDDGTPGALTGTSNADGTYGGEIDFGSTDTAGSYVVCGWLVVGGMVTATTQTTVTVARPPVTLSITVPATLPAGRIGIYTLGTIHYDVGPTSRTLNYSFQRASSGCHPDAYAATSDSIGITGSSSYTVRKILNPDDGRWVLCATIGDSSGHEIDASAGSAVIVVGRAYCVVPKLIGRTLNAAGRLVNRSGCVEGHVHYVHTSRRKQWRILSQSPAPGRRVDPGTFVNVVVGCHRGNRYRGVLYCIGGPRPG